MSQKQQGKDGIYFDWLKDIEGYHLPQWEELPNIGLYMDQIMILILDYLGKFDISSGDENTVTPAMINNYVKMKVIPAPVKKKYSRVHLAYLIIICTLKKSFEISQIRRIIPYGIEEERVKCLYSSFVKQRETMMKDIFSKRMISIDFEKFIDGEPIETANYTDVFKLFTAKLIGGEEGEQGEAGAEKNSPEEPSEKKKKKKEKV